MRVFNPPSASDPKVLLRHFLTYVRDVLGDIVEGRGPVQTGIPIELMPKLGLAWKETLPQFKKMEAELDDVAIEKLSASGLTGVSLDFKLSALQYISRRLIETSLLNWLERLLGIINTIFGSLSSALGGIGEVIQEIKDTIEKLLGGD